MSKRNKRERRGEKAPAAQPMKIDRRWLIVLFLAVIVAAAASVLLPRGNRRPLPVPGDTSVVTKTAPPPAAEWTTNEVAQSIMVTVELDFGPKPPSMAEAVKEIERRYEPAEGTERTFAILDADGWVTGSNKLHIQMHLSMEKPGQGALVFRRTGEVLWRSRIVAAAGSTPQPKRLTILMADTAGKSVMLDGSKGATHVLDVPLDKSTQRVRDLWPDGAEHEFTFIYSVCGCPVKAKVRRTGETTARTTELPVMFPDDPGALETIKGLMGWR